MFVFDEYVNIMCCFDQQLEMASEHYLWSFMLEMQTLRIVMAAVRGKKNTFLMISYWCEILGEMFHQNKCAYPHRWNTSNFCIQDSRKYQKVNSWLCISQESREAFSLQWILARNQRPIGSFWTLGFASYNRRQCIWMNPHLCWQT